MESKCTKFTCSTDCSNSADVGLRKAQEYSRAWQTGKDLERYCWDRR